MGKSAIDYNLNGLDFKKFKQIYLKSKVIEATDLNLFKQKPNFDNVINVYEFDNNKIQFFFKNNKWIVIDIK